MNKYVAILLYSLLCGLLLVAFSLIQGFIKYIFSLAALFAGFKFFGAYDSIKFRIGFILLSIAFFILGMLVFVSIALINDWVIPGVTDNL